MVTAAAVTDQNGGRAGPAEIRVGWAGFGDSKTALDDVDFNLLDYKIFMWFIC